LSMTFQALADPTRRGILARLAAGEADVSELMKPFELSQPTISKHLKVLERAGLVARSRDAQRRPRTLVTAPLQQVDRWLESYRESWEAQFASTRHVTIAAAPRAARKTGSDRRIPIAPNYHSTRLRARIRTVCSQQRPTQPTSASDGDDNAT